MKRVLSLGVAIVALAVFTSDGRAQGQSLERRAPRVTRADRGAFLSLPSNGSSRSILVRFLRSQGRDEATAESLVLVADGAGGRGIRHARFEQRVAGLPVFGAYAKIALNDRGELVSVIENLAPVRGAVRAAQTTAAQAIRAAVRNLYPTVADAATGFFHRSPRATRVAAPNADGSLAEGFLVETWTEASNQLHYTLVNGSGAVADVESRTNSDSYNVFRVYPSAQTPQQIVQGPAPGISAPSRDGWLFAGGQNTLDIAGNNVRAYLDAVSDDLPDGAGASVVDGNFLTAADLTQQPSTDHNRAVAVQNLFFLNNVLHDELYRHGFNELAGNFQETNFTGQGLGSDSVNAEAQDGGGIDNANFATPNDGSNPRMQMYLWSGLGTHNVIAGGKSYLAQGATWGATLDKTGLTRALALVNDAAGVNVNDACEKLPRGSLTNAIALADRGNCDFTVKATNVQNAGAAAIIVANNVDGPVVTMGGSAGRVSIAGVMVSKSDGAALKALGGATATVKLADTPPLSFDGDVDSDIVYHEYGHGLTWRMIGGMSGPLAGAIGEGMSDVLAVILNDNDIVGEYSTGDFTTGIRRQAYNAYNGSYANVTGGEIHDDGEVYGAIGWRLWKNFEAQGVAKDTVLDYIVAGMNFTPATPDFEAMRDGILAAVRAAQGTSVASPSTNECLVWDAFADYGVGVLADGVAKGKRVTVTADFSVPAACPSRPAPSRTNP
jgi:extracellular elastinolytic metalloproteinase